MRCLASIARQRFTDGGGSHIGSCGLLLIGALGRVGSAMGDFTSFGEMPGIRSGIRSQVQHDVLDTRLPHDKRSLMFHRGGIALLKGNEVEGVVKVRGIQLMSQGFAGGRFALLRPGKKPVGIHQIGVA